MVEQIVCKGGSTFKRGPKYHRWKQYSTQQDMVIAKQCKQNHKQSKDKKVTWSHCIDILQLPKIYLPVANNAIITIKKISRQFRIMPAEMWSQLGY